jgi:hypothetical protein
MFPIEGQDLLRVALLAGVMGFAAFCLSYTLYVWHRRNTLPCEHRCQVLAE